MLAKLLDALLLEGMSSGQIREILFASYAAAFTFATRLASRNFLIFALGTFLWSEQTIPNIGAAAFLQPGTGHNWRGGFFRALVVPPAVRPSAPSTRERARVMTSRSINEPSRPENSSTRERMSMVRCLSPKLMRKATPWALDEVSSARRAGVAEFGSGGIRRPSRAAATAVEPRHAHLVVPRVWADASGTKPVGNAMGSPAGSAGACG